MSLLHIRLDQIDKARLQALINTAAAESRTIDYKRTSYGNTDRDYSEFLADVSSFANTSGGDLVIGMDATEGIPTALVPLKMSMDSERLRLEQAARDGLQPRIANIRFHPIPIGENGIDGHVLVIRIPRSYNPPHRVIRQRSNKFWARSSAGKYEPDVNELRLLFNAAPLLADRIRNFRLDRIAKIAAGQAQVPLKNQGKGIIALHIVPLSAYGEPITLPLDQIRFNLNTFVPFGSTSANDARINFDGILKTSNADRSVVQHRTYVQLYRNGIIESVVSELIPASSEDRIIYKLDNTLVTATMRSLDDLAAIAIGPPYVVLLSLIDVAGAQFAFGKDPYQWSGNVSNPLDRDQYHFDEVIVETIPTDKTECANIIRPILDQLANAGGRAVSPIFA